MNLPHWADYALIWTGTSALLAILFFPLLIACYYLKSWKHKLLLLFFAAFPAFCQSTHCSSNYLLTLQAPNRTVWGTELGRAQLAVDYWALLFLLIVVTGIIGSYFSYAKEVTKNKKSIFFSYLAATILYAFGIWCIAYFKLL